MNAQVRWACLGSDGTHEDLTPSYPHDTVKITPSLGLWSDSCDGGAQLTFREIGGILGLSDQRVCRIAEPGVSKLKDSPETRADMQAGKSWQDLY